MILDIEIEKSAKLINQQDCEQDQILMSDYKSEKVLHTQQLQNDYESEKKEAKTSYSTSNLSKTSSTMKINMLQASISAKDSLILDLQNQVQILKSSQKQKEIDFTQFQQETSLKFEELQQKNIQLNKMILQKDNEINELKKEALQKELLYESNQIKQNQLQKEDITQLEKQCWLFKTEKKLQEQSIYQPIEQQMKSKYINNQIKSVDTTQWNKSQEIINQGNQKYGTTSLPKLQEMVIWKQQMQKKFEDYQQGGDIDSISIIKRQLNQVLSPQKPSVSLYQNSRSESLQQQNYSYKQQISNNLKQQQQQSIKLSYSQQDLNQKQNINWSDNLINKYQYRCNPQTYDTRDKQLIKKNSYSQKKEQQF